MATLLWKTGRRRGSLFQDCFNQYGLAKVLEREKLLDQGVLLASMMGVRIYF
jgi:hypothetical protein